MDKMDEMNKISKPLDEMLELVENSKTQTDFYENIYKYLEYAQGDSFLMNVINEESEKLKIEISKIESDPIYDQDTKYKLAERAKNLSVCSDYRALYKDVYVPLYDHKHVKRIDPNSVTFCYVLGIESTPEDSRNSIKWSFNNYYNNTLTNFYHFHDKLIWRVHEIICHTKERDELFLTFNKTKSILNIKGKKVSFRLKNDAPNSHYVLEYIFENGVSEIADYADIIKSKFILEKANWRTIYRACLDIKEKVRKQAGIEDFINIKTGETGYVQINEKYW